MKLHLRLLILFLIGSTLGPIFDGFHTHAGVTGYLHPWMFKMAWWVPFLFGCAAIAIAMTHPDMDRRLGRKNVLIRSWQEIIIGIAWFGTLYFASAVLPFSYGIISVLLGAGSIALWWVYDRSWQGLVMAGMTAVVGTLVEIILVKMDAFYYTNPDFFGVRSWLPWLYVAASVSVGNLGRKLNALEK